MAARHCQPTAVDGRRSVVADAAAEIVVRLCVTVFLATRRCCAAMRWRGRCGCWCQARAVKRGWNGWVWRGATEQRLRSAPGKAPMRARLMLAVMGSAGQVARCTHKRHKLQLRQLHHLQRAGSATRAVLCLADSDTVTFCVVALVAHTLCLPLQQLELKLCWQRRPVPDARPLAHRCQPCCGNHRQLCVGVKGQLAQPCTGYLRACREVRLHLKSPQRVQACLIQRTAPA